METELSTLNDGYDARASIGLALIALLVMGFAYSLAGAGLGRVLFRQAAAGSIVERGGKPVGSMLIAQPFAADGYFHGRPSASNYDPMAAAGSNQARNNPELRKRIEAARISVAAREGIAPGTVPIELVTQSGGGLDPDITPLGADVQIARVAKARGWDAAHVQAFVKANTQARQFGILGQPRINVLALNLALDESH